METFGEDTTLKTTAVDVIIPARNEETTIGGIIDAFLLCTMVGKIIVVDDHSEDNTLSVAMAHHATLVVRGFGLGKGQAVMSGLVFVNTAMVCLCDADLTGFTTEHAEILMDAMPGTMLIGVPEFTANLPWAHKATQEQWEDVSGERCLPTRLLYGIDLHGYAMEVQINHAVKSEGLPIVKRNLTGVKGVPKPNSYSRRIQDYRRDLEWLKENGL
jgi:glycosyltransferase involved in cell wall biosynthesis